MLTLEFVKLIGEIFSFPVQPICSTNKHSNNMYEKLHFEKNNFHTLSVLTQFSTCIRYQCINFCTKGTTLPLVHIMKISEAAGSVPIKSASSCFCCFLQAARRRNCAYSQKGWKKDSPLLLITQKVSQKNSYRQKLKSKIHCECKRKMQR